jgi:hypothetical protein
MANFSVIGQQRFFAKKFGKVKKSGEEGGKTEAEEVSQT